MIAFPLNEHVECVKIQLGSFGGLEVGHCESLVLNVIARPENGRGGVLFAVGLFVM